MIKKILVVSDNERLLRIFIELIKTKKLNTGGRTFEFYCAKWNSDLINKEIEGYVVSGVDIRQAHEEIAEKYDLVISAHCKQLFPESMIEKIKCINVHPGLNPYNRGWYPQVFSIINGMPLGATIHEIDKEIDHGDIIDQIEVPVYSYDTSLDAYNRVILAEQTLLERSVEKILDNDYIAYKPVSEGNLNLRKDFDALREIKLDEVATFGEVIDRLRALTHGDFDNAYYYDKDLDKNVKISIKLSLKED